MVLVKNSSGTWQEVTFRTDGSYIVFEVDEDSNAFYLVQKARKVKLPMLIACGVGIVGLLIGFLSVRIWKNRRRKRN